MRRALFVMEQSPPSMSPTWSINRRSGGGGLGCVGARGESFFTKYHH